MSYQKSHLIELAEVEEISVDFSNNPLHPEANQWEHNVEPKCLSAIAGKPLYELQQGSKVQAELTV